VALFVPTGTPFFSHSYAGAVPPLPGVAVSTTFCPVHIEFDEAEMLIAGTTTAVIVTVMLFELAELTPEQLFTEVYWQLTTALLASVEDENAGVLPPALTPFTFH
jgi:hypothetical protein